MTVGEFCTKFALKNWTPALDLSAPVTGGYAGDMLSWVMGKAEAGAVWMTIMSNQNVAAVALMADVACVVLTEGVEPDEALLTQANVRGIPLFTSDLSTYVLSYQLGTMLSET